MRSLLFVLLLIAGLLGAAWLGGESWLVGRAVAVIGQRDDLAAAQVTPLRDPRRIGLRFEAVDYQTRIGAAPATLHLPWIDLWVPPTLPTEIRATLPDQARLNVDGRAVDLGLTGAEARLRVSATNNMALSRASLRAGTVMLAGQRAIEALSAEARLAPMGYDAPRAAGAAYDIDLDLAALDPAALAPLGLPPLVLPGPVGLNGDLRLWLTAAPGRGMLQGDMARARPVGFRTGGLDLAIGDLRARLVGQAVADDQGRASGRLALYTTQSQGWLQALSDAGLIPGGGVRLGEALLQGLSRMPMDAPAPVAGAAPARAGFSFPDPAEGEVRLPLFLRDGQVFLGDIPVGPAPIL